MLDLPPHPKIFGGGGYIPPAIDAYGYKFGQLSTWVFLDSQMLTEKKLADGQCGKMFPHCGKIFPHHKLLFTVPEMFVFLSVFLSQLYN